MIEKQSLEQLYLKDKLSMIEIAAQLDCSVHKVVYWMDRHHMKRRTISDAIYLKNNPNGDPFCIKPIKSRADAKLLGLGLGLYWGEGTKANKYAVRLGNTDPALLNMFIRFLVELFGVDKKHLHFGLQIFTDIDTKVALEYWTDELGVNPSQFYKPTVTKSGSIGSYHQKSIYGVVTVYFHNKKLRDILVEMLPR